MAEYRIFVGAFPTGEVVDRIQAVRRQHDPKTARITPPHVTLAGTYWRHGPATPANEADTIARLHAVQDRIAAFDLVLGGVHTFLPTNAVIFLGVEATPDLLAARRVLLDAMGMDKHGEHFKPHLTLAMRLDVPQAEALLNDLQPTEWHSGRWTMRMTELALMQRGPGDLAWRAIARLPLTSKP
jgi:2'-5' RNA ligase